LVILLRSGEFNSSFSSSLDMLSSPLFLPSLLPSQLLFCNMDSIVIVIVVVYHETKVSVELLSSTKKFLKQQPPHERENN
jgi:hypothetical protein